MTRTLSALFFERQKQRTHAQLRAEIAGVPPRLAAESVSAPYAENRIDEARPGFDINPPIGSSAANISEKIERKRIHHEQQRMCGND